ncbi:hypothetical protein ACJ41O_012378 [Fusarium nematophilum]
MPPIMQDIGFGSYAFFGGFRYAASVWAYFLVPETKGKTLEEIDDVFGDQTVQEEREAIQSQIVPDSRA